MITTIIYVLLLSQNTDEIKRDFENISPWPWLRQLINSKAMNLSSPEVHTVMQFCVTALSVAVNTEQQRIKDVSNN